MYTKRVRSRQQKIDNTQLQECLEDVKVFTSILDANEEKESSRKNIELVPTEHSLEESLTEVLKQICQKCKCCNKITKFLKDHRSCSSYEPSAENQSSSPAKNQSILQINVRKNVLKSPSDTSHTGNKTNVSPNKDSNKIDKTFKNNSVKKRKKKRAILSGPPSMKKKKIAQEKKDVKNQNVGKKKRMTKKKEIAKTKKI
ncbi:hypothetical protein ABEB36_011007 [Hypothenemus hampei]|uniref:Uncharacterized protein n=1 Tax=Hypothenemus hampei TaxID=57062 RepID=A0ABD1EDW8_HYPHA